MNYSLHSLVQSGERSTSAKRPTAPRATPTPPATQSRRVRAAVLVGCADGGYIVLPISYYLSQPSRPAGEDGFSSIGFSIYFSFPHLRSSRPLGGLLPLQSFVASIWFSDRIGMHSADLRGRSFSSRISVCRQTLDFLL